jgi:hypothetical protein
MCRAVTAADRELDAGVALGNLLAVDVDKNFRNLGTAIVPPRIAVEWEHAVKDRIEPVLHL